MPGDRDGLAEARERGRGVMARPLLEAGRVGPLDDRVARADLRDRDPADRVAGADLVLLAPGQIGDPRLRLRERRPGRAAGRCVSGAVLKLRYCLSICDCWISAITAVTGSCHTSVTAGVDHQQQPGDDQDRGDVADEPSERQRRRSAAAPPQERSAPWSSSPDRRLRPADRARTGVLIGPRTVTGTSAGRGWRAIRTIISARLTTQPSTMLHSSAAHHAEIAAGEHQHSIPGAGRGAKPHAPSRSRGRRARPARVRPAAAAPPTARAAAARGRRSTSSSAGPRRAAPPRTDSASQIASVTTHRTNSSAAAAPGEAASSGRPAAAGGGRSSARARRCSPDHIRRPKPPHGDADSTIRQPEADQDRGRAAAERERVAADRPRRGDVDRPDEPQAEHGEHGEHERNAGRQHPQHPARDPVSAPAGPRQPVDRREQHRERSAPARAAGSPTPGSPCRASAGTTTAPAPRPDSSALMVCKDGAPEPRDLALAGRLVGRRHPRSGRRDQHRRLAAGRERALLGGRQREREVQELAAEALVAGGQAGLLLRAPARPCCAAAAAPPASSPTTARRSESGTSVPAMSPSTITASTGCGRLRASSAAPAAPTEALVEASTIERCCVCAESTWASSSRTAVPDRSAGAPTWVESRWATITIEPGLRPGERPGDRLDRLGARRRSAR